MIELNQFQKETERLDEIADALAALGINEIIEQPNDVA